MSTQRVAATALTYAVLGPAVGLGVTLAVFATAIAELGPVEGSSYVDLAVSAYVIGLPPLLATGLLLAASERRGMGALGLFTQAVLFGFLFGGLSALVWGFLGSLSVAPSWRLILAIAAIGAVAALACAIVMALTRRRREVA